MTVDGNDAWAVHTATSEAINRACRGEGPTLLECLAYRWHGHMEGEDADYRDAAQIESWKQRDRIQRLEDEPLKGGILTQDQATEIAQQAENAVGEALVFARASAEPSVQALTQDIFAPERAGLYRPQPRRPATREINYSKALYEEQAEEMGRDERVFLLGEDVLLVATLP